MPHITLLYPFMPKGNFNKILPDLAQVGWEQPPLELTLQNFRWFRHGRESYTVWLAPETEGAVVKLHGALLKNEQDVALFERLAFMARRQAR